MDAFALWYNPNSFPARISRRKLILQDELPESSRNRTRSYDSPPTPVPASPANPIEPATLDALNAVLTTPHEHSFLSRLVGMECGLGAANPNGLFGVDWETSTPWLEFTADIREHHKLKHPEEEHDSYIPAPITYTSLHSVHLDQVNDLLARNFWENIDITDCLGVPSVSANENKYTVLAMYKHLVVGAVLTLPMSLQEIYIAYLVVRSGWEGEGIATSMLYHLITQQPGKDITLHVSVTNPAMLLYNCLGFKSEEFIVDFYRSYMDSDAKGSRNAVKLRLRALG